MVSSFIIIHVLARNYSIVDLRKRCEYCYFTHTSVGRVNVGRELLLLQYTIAMIKNTIYGKIMNAAVKISKHF